MLQMYLMSLFSSFFFPIESGWKLGVSGKGNKVRSLSTFLLTFLWESLNDLPARNYLENTYKIFPIKENI